MEEEDRPKPKAVHIVGENLSTLSVGELQSRIGALQAEIQRLEVELRRKSVSLAAANAIFKT